jgi:hypothetical protein
MAQAGARPPGAEEGGPVDPALPLAGSCFDNEPGFDREEARSPMVENIPAVLADATYRIFNCARLPDARLADAFAAISLHIARRKPPVACFDGDAGVLHGTWDGHRAWAIQRGRAAADDNVGWKINSVLACPMLAQSDRLTLYVDIMEVLAQADRGAVERLPDVDAAPPDNAEPAGTGAPVTADGPAPAEPPVFVTREAPEGLGPPPMDQFREAMQASGRGPRTDEVTPPAEVGLPPDADISIQVVAATWGANCPGAQPADDTEALANDCGGYTQSCEHLIDTLALRDPAPGCAKTYAAEWRCGKDPTPHRAEARPRPEISPLATDLFVKLECGH